MAKPKITMPSRPKSSLLYGDGKRGINRGYSQEGPLGKEDKKYLNKYIKYLAKKDKMTASKQYDEENTIDWNTTKIRSYNAHGVTDRTDGLPGRLDVGYLDMEDYSLYYMSIDSNSAMSLSQSLSRGNSRPKKYRKGYKPNNDNEMMNLSYDYARISSAKGHSSTTKNKSESKISYKAGQNTNKSSKKRPNNNVGSHVAFIKLIFNLLDKAKVGEVKKIDLIRDLKLDHKILRDLGFESEDVFLSCLCDNETSKEGYVNEDEFIQFLLSNLDVNYDKKIKDPTATLTGNKSFIY